MKRSCTVRCRWWLSGLICVALVPITVVAFLEPSEELDHRSPATSTAVPPEVHTDLGPDAALLRTNPIENIATRAAAEVLNVEDSWQVIGIVDGRSARAYPIRFLGYPNHVCIDDLGDTSIAITYCGRTACARVLLRDDANTIQLGGWSGSEMLLFTENAYWGHLDPQLPLSDHPFELTTWGEWRAKYPHTDVYVGEIAGVESSGTGESE